MKKVVLFALLLTTVAASSAFAQVHIEPKWNATYYCDYQNYTGNASDPGYSTWHSPQYFSPGGTPLIRAKETFTTSYGTDTYKCSWAKPVTPPYWGSPTTWEFTFNPDGPQCKKTLVFPGAYKITFDECTDGHRRTCNLIY